MITLKQLTWDNCFSYGPGNTIDLESNSLTQIIGTNGVGKSSIPLILEEVLFNKNSKGVKKADIPNRNINDGYNISLIFEKDHIQYKIDVARSKTIKVRLSCEGEDISSHTATNTYKSIEELIGLDFKTFSQLVYQNTNASLQFLTATDANRKKFLIDLLNLEEYVELFEVFKEAHKEATVDLSRLQGKTETILSWFEKNKLTDTNPKDQIILKNTNEEDYKTLSSLESSLKNIENLNRKINENNQYKELLDKIDIKEVSNIETNSELPLDDILAKLADATNRKAASEKILKKMKALGDHCPTCDQEVSPIFKQTLIDTEETLEQQAKEDLVDLLSKKLSIQDNNKLYTHKVTQQREWERLYNSIDEDIDEEVLVNDNLKSQITKVKENIAVIEDFNRQAIIENTKVERFNTRITVWLEQKDALEAELKEIKKETEAFETLNNNLDILKKSFSTNGLIAYKIENLVGELEDLTNEYLAELSGGRFTLGFVVSNDKLNVEITDNERIVDILALSSGELARVNTATLLAIRKLMSSISKSKINVLFLDEVINVLDEAGKEKIVEVLLQEDLNTYLVSHQWTHPLLEKIVITKRNNISILE